jgi:long-chain acyl-CoA synthetase
MNLLNILEHSARLYKDKPAVISPAEQMAYGQFAEACRKLGRALWGLGLKKGDRVGILDVNSLELALAHFAVPACGLVALPLNHRLAPDEIVGILADARISCLIYSPPFTEVLDKIRSSLPFVRHFICTKPGGRELNLPALMNEAPALRLPEPRAEDLATLLYTSGTTGRPKGVQLSHSNILSAITSLLIELGLRSEDIGLAVAPLFHVAGCQTYMALLARGCTVQVLPSFEPIKTLEALRATRATVTLLVPAMISALLNTPGQDQMDISSLRLMIYAGAPMPEEMLKAAMNRFGQIFFQIYGLTETSVLTCLTVKDHENLRVLGSAGREMFGSEVKIVDPDGQATQPGLIGQVVARGGNVTTGYWEAPEETAAAIKDGWFQTGDLACRDKEGYLILKDRKKDMIVSGGENIYPIEAENILYQLPAILEAAIIGVPDDRWGEKVVALVHLRPGQTISQEEILTFCRERLAGYKCPKTIEFMGPFPRTSSGKIKKNELREPYWKGLDRKIH